VHGTLRFGLRRFGGTEEATETGLTGLRWVVGSVLGLRPRLGETGPTGLKHSGGDRIRGKKGGAQLMAVKVHGTFKSSESNRPIPATKVFGKLQN
jgi:hypothetical protein